MICPKCGFEQEDRLDCVKCGIVFSKYWAMQAEAPAPVATPHPPAAENGASMEISELRQSVRDLGRRFSEVEFERVERSQLRGELKALDKKFQSSFDQLSLRLEGIEKLLSNPQAPPALPDGTRLIEVQKELIEANVDPLATKIAALEPRLERLENDLITLKNSINSEVSRLLETAIEPVAGKVADLDERLQHREKESSARGDSRFAESLSQFDTRLAGLENKVLPSLAVPLAEESAAARQEMQNRIRLLDDEVAAAKATVERLPGIQQEVAEVRSEIGRIWVQIQDFEKELNRPASPPAEPSTHDRLELDIRSIRDSMQEIREFITRIAAKS